MKKYLKTRSENLLTQKNQDEILIYDLLNNKAYNLNKTSSLIFELLDGNNSISDIKNHLNKQLTDKVNDEFIWFSITQFQKNNLILIDDNVKTGFEGLTRREAIRKVGFVALAALPVIAVITAPTPVMAQSGCVPGEPGCPTDPPAPTEP